MTTKEQPEALRLADELEEPLPDCPTPSDAEARAAAELRRQHHRITELEAKLEPKGTMHPNLIELIKVLGIKAGCIQNGDRITWGSEVVLMRKAAAVLQSQHNRIAELEKGAAKQAEPVLGYPNPNCMICNGIMFPIPCKCRKFTKPMTKLTPLSNKQVQEILTEAGYDVDNYSGSTLLERASFINGLRHGERAHGITGNVVATSLKQPQASDLESMRADAVLTRRST